MGKESVLTVMATQPHPAGLALYEFCTMVLLLFSEEVAVMKNSE